MERWQLSVKTTTTLNRLCAKGDAVGGGLCVQDMKVQKTKHCFIYEASISVGSKPLVVADVFLLVLPFIAELYR